MFTLPSQAAVRSTLRIVYCIALSAAGTAQGASVTVPTGQVVITYDNVTSLRWSSDSQNGGTIGGSVPLTLGASVTGLGNGLLITAPNETSLTSGAFAPEEAFAELSFQDVGFAAQPGYLIAGYQISYRGAFSTSGTSTVSIPTGPLDTLTTSPSPPGQSGRFLYNVVRSPLTDLISPQVVRISFSTKNDGDTATASITDAMLVAVVTNVPEPETHALTFAGLAALAAWLRRSRR